MDQLGLVEQPKSSGLEERGGAEENVKQMISRISSGGSGNDIVVGDGCKRLDDVSNSRTRNGGQMFGKCTTSDGHYNLQKLTKRS